MQLSYMNTTSFLMCDMVSPFEVHAALLENTLAVFSTTRSSTAPETLSYEKCLLQSKYYNNILFTRGYISEVGEVYPSYFNRRRYYT